MISCALHALVGMSCWPAGAAFAVASSAFLEAVRGLLDRLSGWRLELAALVCCCSSPEVTVDEAIAVAGHRGLGVGLVGKVATGMCLVSVLGADVEVRCSQ